MGGGGFPIYYNITIGGEESYGTPNLYYVINGQPLRTCRDLNAIRGVTAKEQKGRMGNGIKWEISTRNVTTPTNDAKDKNPSMPKLFLQ